MIKMYGVPGYERVQREYYCDCCGRRCYPNSNREKSLYKHDGDQLCFECYWEAIEPETVE